MFGGGCAEIFRTSHTLHVYIYISVFYKYIVKLIGRYTKQVKQHACLGFSVNAKFRGRVESRSLSQDVSVQIKNSKLP